MISTLKTIAIYTAVLAIGYIAGIATVNMQEGHMDHGPGAHIANNHTPAEATAAPGHFDGDDVSAPDFTLPSLDGSDVSLSDYRGKWVFVNFWATWCGPCVVEMPMMNNLYKELNGEGLEMVAISIDKKDVADVQAFVDEHKLVFTVLHDKESSLSSIYGLTSLPLSYVISPEGKVVAQAHGAREWDNPQMVQYIRDLMSGEITEDEVEKAENAGQVETKT